MAYKALVPERILSDQGRNFEYKIIADFCKSYGVKILRDLLMSHRGNTQCENHNRTWWFTEDTPTLEKRTLAWTELDYTYCLLSEPSHSFRWMHYAGVSKFQIGKRTGCLFRLSDKQEDKREYPEQNSSTGWESILSPCSCYQTFLPVSSTTQKK